MNNKNIELSIITPSFNEEGNIQGVIQRTSKALKDTRHEIIVEDDSTDTTPQKVHQLEGKYPIKLFHRDKNKLKLAPAVLHGFANASGKYLCVIDSDLQHPPEKVAEMLAKAEETNADVIVASRYIKGGSAEGLGSFMRKAISIATKILAYVILDPSRKTTDPTSGFFLFRRALIQNIKLDPIGYKILIEILARTDPEKVIDIPYRFESRTENISKSTFNQGVLMLKHFLKLFLEVPRCGRFVKFGLVGASGVIVNLGITAIARELGGFSEKTSIAFGILISIFTNFMLNNFFTWRDLRAKSPKQWASKVMMYYVGSGIGAAIQMGISIVGLDYLHVHYLVADIFGILVAMFFNFFFSNFVVWRAKKG